MKLRKIYEKPLLRKLNLRAKFSRKVLYSRVTILRVEILILKIEMSIIILKLYLAHKY